MEQLIAIDILEFTGKKKFKIADAATKRDNLYKSKAEYQALIEGFRAEIDEKQSMLYAHNRYGLLVIFQAMDAAGKDSTIQHVLTGVNPFGIKIHNFKRPSEQEIDHDFLWRTNACLPERGEIAVFNRSYYEEVLVVRVHPEILHNSQRLPLASLENEENIWKQRFESIVDLEKHWNRNGFKVVKFFLNVSKQEQGKRLIERIEDPAKNWKFEEQDLKEREKWDEYMHAYEDCINATATPEAPWYIIPADDKKNMRLMVSQILLYQLLQLDISYPVPNAERQAQLKNLIDVIVEQDKL